MKFAIFTHVTHIIELKEFYAYAPYVREMNIWGNYVQEILIVAPLASTKKTAIDRAYSHPRIKMITIKSFDLLNFKSLITAFLKIPEICRQIFMGMKSADHIHLRCPGNIGLLGCFMQILFPATPKTAKYAGNWDPKSKQPWSYRLQKWILRNPFLTRNMQVLVYGEWEGSTKNIKSFFTATYYESDKKAIMKRNLLGQIKFLFVGTLSKGKRPLYAIQLVEKLYQAGHNVCLDLYGEGHERSFVENYIRDKKLESIIVLHGNKTAAMVQKAYENSHFIILASQSEGWPKVLAEGMFWGCLPVATAVSCVPNMLENGKRGLILDMNLETDCQNIISVIEDEGAYQSKVVKAVEWSRTFTLDYFEKEIKDLLIKD